MTDNKLKLNDDKTEVMIISSSRMSTALLIPDSFEIGNASVPFSGTVKNLGVTLDCHLSLKTHVLNPVRTVLHLIQSNASAIIANADESNANASITWQSNASESVNATFALAIEHKPGV